jgi:hypothetical protein
VAIREPLEQQSLPGNESQLELPFPTMDWETVRYKVTGIVTNRDLSERVLERDRQVIVRLVGTHT